MKGNISWSQVVKSGTRKSLVTELWLPSEDRQPGANGGSSSEDEDEDEEPSAPHIVAAARAQLFEIYADAGGHTDEQEDLRGEKIETLLLKFAGVEPELVEIIREKASRGELGFD